MHFEQLNAFRGANPAAPNARPPRPRLDLFNPGEQDGESPRLLQVYYEHQVSSLLAVSQPQMFLRGGDGRNCGPSSCSEII